MSRFTIPTLAVGLALASAFACHVTRSNNDPDSGGDTDTGADAEHDDAASKRAPEYEPERIALTRNAAPRGPMREAELDPDARAALTLDIRGRVQLWPLLDGSEGEGALPYTLPVSEPLWMSLARGREGSFTTAFIDTSNAGLVGAVMPGNGAGADSAAFVELFRTPPSDPLLELHALEGGERMLALGVDHRVRLYDRNGELLSQIDEPGFAPWQLRVADGVDGTPALALVLSQPLRVQALALDGDTLVRVGEPRAVELDRGPNHNDLALSPDGRTIAGLRRPRAKTRQWSIELVALDSGARSLIAGRGNTLVRPRMHFVENGRILLESGSGHGYWVDLSQAETPSDPADLHPDSRFAERLSKRTSFDTIELAASGESRDDLERDDDQGLRMHASVRAGVRVGIDREHDTLVVDALAQGTRLGLYQVFPAVARAGLSADGATVAWANTSTIEIEPVDGSGPVTYIEHELGAAAHVSIVDADRLLLVGDRTAGLFTISTGELLATSKLDRSWGFRAIAYQPGDAPGRGMLAWAETNPNEPLRALEIEPGALGQSHELDQGQLDPWFNLRRFGDDSLDRMLSRLGLDLPYGAVDIYAADGRGRYFFTLDSARTPLYVAREGQHAKVRLPAGQGRELVPSPDGRRVAVLLVRKHREGFRRRVEDLLVTLVDVEAGEVLWTRGFFGARERIGVDWSADGERLALTSWHANVAMVVDATSGDALLERGPRTVRVERLTP